MKCHWENNILSECTFCGKDFLMLPKKAETIYCHESHIRCQQTLIYSFKIIVYVCMSVCMHGLVQTCICRSAIKAGCLSSLYMFLLSIFIYFSVYKCLPVCIYVHNMYVPSAQEGHTTTLDLLKHIVDQNWVFCNSSKYS